MPKAAQAEDMTGHNSGDYSPLEAQQIYMFHFNECLTAREAVEAARAEEKAKRKRAKAHGIVLADIDYGMRCAEIEDPEIIAAEQRRHNEIARWFSIPVGTQSDFDFNREPVIDRAKREGAAAGYRNGPREPSPHATDSKAGQAWLKSYDAARKEANEALAAAMKKADAKAQEKAAAETGGDGEAGDGLGPDYAEDEAAA